MQDRGPTAPIFVFEDKDIGIYESVELAQNDLEPPEISDRIYIGFDAEGRLLTIETNGRDTFISLQEVEPSNPDLLLHKLRAFLQYVGDTRAEETSELSRLVEIAKDHAEQPRTLRGRFRGQG